MKKMLEVNITFNLEYINFLEELGIPFKNKIIDYKVKDGNKHRLTYENCLITEEDADRIDSASVNGVMSISKNKTATEEFFKIYSDGGSFNNGKKDENLPSFSSYAYYILDEEGNTISGNGGKEDDTNNIGELKGCILGLDDLKENLEGSDKVNIILISDSQYVIQGINTYINGWIKRGWKNNSGNPTPNKEYWYRLYKEYLSNDKFNIYTKWVRGHTDNDGEDFKYNDSCDYDCNVVINKWLKTQGLKQRKI